MKPGKLIKRPVFLHLGIAAFLLIAFLDSSLQHFQKDGHDYGQRPAFAAAAAALMAIWWLSEATSIYLTALVPLVLFPLLGVFGEGAGANLGGAVSPYLDSYMFLYLGGLGIGAAMQQWGLHSRTALSILRALGSRPPRVLLGMLVATATVSLWISNTATAAMMLPIAMALAAQIESQAGGIRRPRFCGALMLAVAYGANVGGMGTKIGTPTNLAFTGFVAIQYGREVSFLEFLAIGLPFVLLFIPVVWWMLWLDGRRDAPPSDLSREVIDRELRALGRMSRGEWVVLVVFAFTAGLWILSQPLHALLDPHLAPAFDRLGLKFHSKHIEGWIGVLAMAALLLIPVRGHPRGPRALNLREVKRIPWETLVLLGGGFALAGGIEASGLSKWMGDQLAVLRGMPAPAQYLTVCTVTVFFGAVASNTATANVILVVLKSAGVPDVIPLMAAASLAASCDFMLPAGTPPNAIVFGSGYLTIPRMARVGFLLDLAAALLVALWGFSVIRWVLG